MIPLELHGPLHVESIEPLIKRASIIQLARSNYPQWDFRIYL